MITIVISEDEAKTKELLSRILHGQGYDLPKALSQENIIKFVKKEDLGPRESLRDKIIELEENLHSEKKGVLYKSVLDAVEKPLIERVLGRCEGNQLKAAKVLGLNRNTLRTKIKKLGINAQAYRS